MTDALIHRGPDDQGAWIDRETGVALGHRRLAILDTSPAGRQPMLSSEGGLVCVYNGEIYNHLEMREQLAKEGHRGRWGSTSDTETLLAAWSFWGAQRTLRELNGMFAFAMWDRREKTLTLVRDRLGEKPLYYGSLDDIFYFGSELRALGAHPRFAPSVDRQALAAYLSYSYVPTPMSIFKGIRKLVPGSSVTVELGGNRRPQYREPRRYWCLEDHVGRPAAITAGDALQKLEGQLLTTVRQRMLSDVPIGALLSGGIDSTLVAALMQEQSPTRVRTFTVGFAEFGYDESPDARAVARHLGTEHTELIVGPREALDVIPHLGRIYSEPFADSSQIPTYLVSRLASSDVSVALTGDGGDELFGGYNRYLEGARQWQRAGRLPAVVRRVAARAILSLGPSAWDRIWESLRQVLPRTMMVRAAGDKLHKFAAVLEADSAREYHGRLASTWPGAEGVVRGIEQMPPSDAGEDRFDDVDSIIAVMMALDTMTYLPDDILVKVDRAAMACGLETRVPFLDHRVVEMAWSLPMECKIRGAEGKWILREIARRRVPESVLERPKGGFGIPLGEWLRGPLREWATEALSPLRLERGGYFAVEPISRLWREHESGRRNHAHRLWNVLMFQNWLEENPLGSGRP